MDVVGTLPQGFPPLTLPRVHLSDLALLVGGAAGIALVSLADTIATASAFAERSGDELDASGEMIGIGTANLAAGLFQGFPVSTSGSRTAVAEQAGAKTQVTGLVGAVLITLMLVLVPGLLRDLPQPTLAAVVITASLSLADIPGTVRLWHQSRPDWVVSIGAFAGVALLGVLPGIVVAVLLSIANVFRRAWWPYQTVLGRVPDLPGFHDVHSYPEAEQLPGLVIFRFDGPLFFANSRTFRDQILRIAAASPPPSWIVVAAEPITDVDTTAADMLKDLDEAINAQGVSLVFAEMKDPVRRKIDRYELTQTIDPEHFFATLDAAVSAFRSGTDADWAAASGGATDAGRAPASVEGHGDRAGQPPVHGEEVAVVRDEIAGRRLLVVGHDPDRAEAAVVGVGDQGRPLRVDVELHRAHGAGPLQDLRERDHRLVVRRRVDQVAVAVDPDARAPDAHRVSEREPPLRAVVQGRVQAAVVDDQRQALAGERDLRPGDRARLATSSRRRGRRDRRSRWRDPSLSGSYCLPPIDDPLPPSE